MKLNPLIQPRHFLLKNRRCYHSTLYHPVKQQSHNHEPLRFDQPAFTSTPKTWFSLLGLCNNIRSLKKVHSLLTVHGLTRNLVLGTKLVSLYGSLGHVSSARLLFDEMPDPDFYSFKVMLRLYLLSGRYEDVLRFYTCMRICIGGHDNVVFSVVLKACSELRDIDEGRKVHCVILKVGNPDSFVFSGLIDMYAKCGEIGCSRVVFDEVVDKNVVSWTSLIVGYVQNDCPKEGLMMFNGMREGFGEANEFTWGSIVTACSRLGALHQGKWVHGFLIKSGFELNSFLVTALVDMYAKCREVKDARAVFDGVSNVDLVLWTAMIVGYTQNGCADMALTLFIEGRRSGLVPNPVTVATILSACAQLGNSVSGMSVHCQGMKIGLEDATVTNALVDMYSKCHMMKDAFHIFDSISDKDVVAWNSMISGLLHSGSAHKALELFQHMKWDSCSPDAVTLAIVLSAYAHLGALQVGSTLHAYSIKAGFSSSNVYVGTALLNFYAKCGDADSARDIFDEMGIKNAITWSAMIGGYGIQGDSSTSLSLFGDMVNKNELRPNEAIFTTILSACRYTGMVSEGWTYFNSMCKDYNLVPSTKHFACMIDLLSRAGRLEEALDFLEKMPIQPEVSMFAAFLHGCGLYSRFDLGEVAIKKMMELHPDEACYYVLISNLYASDGRWSQVNEVREFMEQKGLRKFPGHSIIEMDNMDDCLIVRGAT